MFWIVGMVGGVLLAAGVGIALDPQGHTPFVGMLAICGGAALLGSLFGESIKR